ncbi:MAG: hypothetical protein U1B78_04055 [Dehalococcoidia bacterium]|nr:hypothetical protein [Dehalococcoidia bacterium]
MAGRLRLPLLALALLGLAFAFAACNSDDQPDDTAARITPGEAAPELTESDRARAEQILQADPTLQDALDGNAFTIASEFEVWRNGEVKLGAGTNLVFDEPVTLEYAWPYIENAEAGSAGYSVKHFEAYRAEGARGVSVLIDLLREEVVQILPFTGEGFQPVPLEEFLPTPPPE